MNHQIIIVGAGPAGSAAAIVLSELGHDVLLIDRCDFPRDKVCGDGVPPSAFQLLSELGLGDKLNQTQFYPIHGAKIISPTGYNFDFNLTYEEDYDFCIAPRFTFDDLIFRHALESGAEFCKAKVMEPIINDGKIAGVIAEINGEIKTIFSDMVIGADGVNSVIAKNLRKRKQKNNHRVIALRGYMEGFETIPHTVEGYLTKTTWPGYVWIFPLSEDKANIGLGMRMDKYIKCDKSLKQLLYEFLNMTKLKERLRNDWQLKHLSASPMNVGSQKNIQRVYDGAILVGDAAAWVNPLTGGGICNAIASGKIAGDVVHNAFRKNNFSRQFLSEYQTRCDKLMRTEILGSYIIQRSLSELPFLLDPILKIANSKVISLLLNKIQYLTDIEIKAK